MKENITLVRSINEAQKCQVAKMYYQAFAKKFSTIWLFADNEEEATKVLINSINYENGLYALCDEEVMGFVGLETGDSFYTQLTYSAFLSAFNFFDATWRVTAYGLYRIFHGEIRNDAVHIDPIVVSSKARGLGIGSKLLDGTYELTRSLNKHKVILEVVDTNPDAKKLYERHGFHVVKEENLSILTKEAGFSIVYYMEKRLE